jgi:hypothetical protein
MTWGTSKWGEGLSVLRTYQKVVSNTQSMTWAHTQVADFVRTISVAVVLPAFEMSSERLANGSTWNYVFNDNSNEAENRYFPTYSTPTAADATFTCQAAASTVWS